MRALAITITGGLIGGVATDLVQKKFGHAACAVFLASATAFTVALACLSPTE